jgi:prepilin-type N-terminal cleavage/methylation domain-containing protein
MRGQAKVVMNRKGFTLIELVIIIILIAIVAVVVAPKLGDVTTTKASSFRDKLKTDIRYAQDLAMTRNTRYRVYFNGSGAGAPANGYIIVSDSNANGTWGETGEIAMDPAGGGNLSVTLNTGQYAGITVSTPAGGFIEFNSLGVPTAAVTLTITPGGQTVTVTAQTGAVN